MTSSTYIVIVRLHCFCLLSLYS